MVMGLKQALYNVLKLNFLQCPKPCCGILNILLQEILICFKVFVE